MGESFKFFDVMVGCWGIGDFPGDFGNETMVFDKTHFGEIKSRTKQ